MESKDPMHDRSAGGFASFFTTPFATVWPKMSRRLWHRQQTWCAFDSTALALSKTGVEKINKVTHSERS